MAEINDSLLKVAKELNELYLFKKAALPYSLNVISELHADENANSRILKGLLQYSCNGQFPILRSFIELIDSLADCEVDIPIKKPELTNEEGDERGRIDLLIQEKKSYAIIVENKIWDAYDQKKQIEKYIDYVERLGVPKRKIFVVYLTHDGNKKISDDSLTDKAKKYLGCSNKSNGRFICMNFMDDIMPWLDTLVDMEDVQKEPLLSSAIIQYGDYLGKIFDARKEDIEIENELEKKLMEKLQIENFQELLQVREDVDRLYDCVISKTNDWINNICEKKICKAIERKGYSILYSDFGYGNFHLEVSIPKWKKSRWAIRTGKNSILWSGIWNDPENKVAKKYKSMLNDVYEKSDVEGWIGWNRHKEYELNDAFWISFEAHPTKFVNFIINEIERVVEATKDMKL